MFTNFRLQIYSTKVIIRKTEIPFDASSESGLD